MWGGGRSPLLETAPLWVAQETPVIPKMSVAIHTWVNRPEGCIAPPFSASLLLKSLAQLVNFPQVPKKVEKWDLALRALPKSNHGTLAQSPLGHELAGLQNSAG